MNLSEHFTLTELTVTATGSPNAPATPQHLQNLEKLAREILEPIREWSGGPLHITSGYRTPVVNEKLRLSGYAASKKSQHLVGEAADFVSYQRPLAQLWWAIAAKKEIPISWGQCILYFHDRRPRFIHISLPTEKLRNEVLICINSCFHRLA